MIGFNINRAIFGNWMMMIKLLSLGVSSDIIIRIFLLRNY